jgi:hypothetical protein
MRLFPAGFQQMCREAVTKTYKPVKKSVDTFTSATAQNLDCGLLDGVGRGRRETLTGGIVVV